MGAFSPSRLGLIFLLLLLLAVGRYIRMRRTRYAFGDGWLTVRRGILFVDDKAYEITHLVNAEIKRGPLDLLTGNGKLVLDFEKYGRVTLVGLAPFKDLVKLRNSLLNGARVLRSHPLLKGLIGT